jgi:hypothetical protein
MNYLNEVSVINNNLKTIDYKIPRPPVGGLGMTVFRLCKGSSGDSLSELPLLPFRP